MKLCTVGTQGAVLNTISTLSEIYPDDQEGWTRGGAEAISKMWKESIEQKIAITGYDIIKTPDGIGSVNVRCVGYGYKYIMPLQ